MRPTIYTHVTGRLLLCFSVLLFAACAEPREPAEEAVSLPDTAEASGAGTTTAAEATEAIEVALSEYEIEMPASIPAGPTVFRVTNAGSVEHNFEIEGQDMEEVFVTRLQPGETRTMEVELAPGTYTVYCPVDDHRQRGMEMQLTVTGSEPEPAAY